jgi:transcriptional regulator GlxA family with amidase domain
VLRESAGVRVDILMFEGFDELDVVAPLEVLRRAAPALGLDVRLVTLAPQSTVTGAYGLRLIPDAVYSADADVLVVPGGGWLDGTAAGARAEARRGDLLTTLTAAADAGTLMASVCTGAMLLAHAGVIGSRRATTHHGAWMELQATGAELVRERVVDDGMVVTAGGVTSGIDMALWLVERPGDASLADDIANAMEHARTRPLDPPGSPPASMP